MSSSRATPRSSSNNTVARCTRTSSLSSTCSEMTTRSDRTSAASWKARFPSRVLAQLALVHDGDHRRHGRRGGSTQKFSGRSNTPAARTAFLFFTSSTDSIWAAITQGGEGLIPAGSDTPGRAQTYPLSHSPRPARFGSRTPIAHTRDRRGHSARPTRSTPLNPHARAHTADSRTHTVHTGTSATRACFAAAAAFFGRLATHAPVPCTCKHGADSRPTMLMNFKLGVAQEGGIPCVMV